MKNSNVGLGVLCIVEDPEVERHLQAMLAPEASFISPKNGIFTNYIFTRKAISPASVIIFEWQTKFLATFAKIDSLRAHNSALFALCSDDESEHITALQLGCDEIITLPVSRLMFAQRLRLLNRRRNPHMSASGTLPLFDDAKPADMEAIVSSKQRIIVDRGTHHCVIGADGKRHSVALTKTEFEVIDMLLRESDRCISKDQFIDSIWGYEFVPSTNVVESLISTMRSKFKKAGAPVVIENVRGAGYRLARDRVAFSSIN